MGEIQESFQLFNIFSSHISMSLLIITSLLVYFNDYSKRFAEINIWANAGTST